MCICNTNLVVPELTYTCSQPVGLCVAKEWKLQNVQSAVHFYVGGYFSPLQNADSGEVNVCVLVWSSTVYSCLTIGRQQNLLSPTNLVVLPTSNLSYSADGLLTLRKGRPTAVCARLCARVVHLWLLASERGGARGTYLRYCVWFLFTRCFTKNLKEQCLFLLCSCVSSPASLVCIIMFPLGFCSPCCTVTPCSDLGKANLSKFWTRQAFRACIWGFWTNRLTHAYVQCWQTTQFVLGREFSLLHINLANLNCAAVWPTQGCFFCCRDTYVWLDFVNRHLNNLFTVTFYIKSTGLCVSCSLDIQFWHLNCTRTSSTRWSHFTSLMCYVRQHVLLCICTSVWAFSLPKGTEHTGSGYLAHAILHSFQDQILK